MGVSKGEKTSTFVLVSKIKGTKCRMRGKGMIGTWSSTNTVLARENVDFIVFQKAFLFFLRSVLSSLGDFIHNVPKVPYVYVILLIQPFMIAMKSLSVNPLSC